MNGLVSINRYKNRIRKASWLFLSLLFTFNLKAQINLVPNPSFEIYDTCPDNPGQIHFAIPWFQPHNGSGDVITSSSTDLFHSCVSGFSGTPDNVIGFQYPRTGLGYAGISPYFSDFNPNSREYIEVELTATLNLNKKYCVSWYVSLAEDCYYACGEMGAYFSPDSLLNNNNWSYINVVPQVKSPSGVIIKDTANWVMIKGSFVATGNEKFLTIGNFNTGANTPLDSIPGSAGAPAYYYMDDVSVVELPEITAGIDASICPGESVQLDASCTGCWPGLKYRWFPAEGLSDATLLNPVASPLQTTAYYFGLTDPTGAVPCMEDHMDSLTIYVTPAPIEAGADVTIPEGGSTVLMAEGGMSYEWYPTEGLSCTACKDPAATPGNSTIYYVTGVNPEGCPGTDSVRVTIVDTSCGEVFVPNVFSPNGDGQNDLQCVYGPCIEQIKFAIYNRWGQKVFESNNREICWDGTYKDTRLNNGVFVYTLTATLSTGLSVRQKGHITLLR